MVESHSGVPPTGPWVRLGTEDDQRAPASLRPRGGSWAGPRTSLSRVASPTSRPPEPGVRRADSRCSAGGWFGPRERGAQRFGYGSLGCCRALGAEPAARSVAHADRRLPADPAAAASAARPAPGLRAFPGPDPLWENQAWGAVAPGRLPGLWCPQEVTAPRLEPGKPRRGEPGAPGSGSRQGAAEAGAGPARPGPGRPWRVSGRGAASAGRPGTAASASWPRGWNTPRARGHRGCWAARERELVAARSLSLGESGSASECRPGPQASG